MTLLLLLPLSPGIVWLGGWLLVIAFTALSFWRRPWCGHRACGAACRYQEVVR